jgi:hypothetical protein
MNNQPFFRTLAAFPQAPAKPKAVGSRQEKRNSNIFDDDLNDLLDQKGIKLKIDKYKVLNKFIVENELSDKDSQEVRAASDVLKSQMAKLSLRDRTATTINLSFDRTSSTGLNETVLDYFPHLRARAELLYAKKDEPRQQRADAIDLTIISEFMHDQSRCV